jgi:hypothetical protein
MSRELSVWFNSPDPGNPGKDSMEIRHLPYFSPPQKRKTQVEEVKHINKTSTQDTL